MPLTNPVLSASTFHQKIIKAKDDHDLIEVLKNYISAIGGFGNAPIEVFKRLHI